jgi:hypothetical protein
VINGAGFTEIAALNAKRGIMDTTAILKELETERERLDTAIAALQGKRTNKNQRRIVSGAVRRKQSLAAKKRWRAAKRAGKNRL